MSILCFGHPFLFMAVINSFGIFSFFFRLLNKLKKENKMKKSLIILVALIGIVAGSTSAFASTTWAKTGNGYIGYHSYGGTTSCVYTGSGMRCY